MQSLKGFSLLFAFYHKSLGILLTAFPVGVPVKTCPASISVGIRVSSSIIFCDFMMILLSKVQKQKNPGLSEEKPGLCFPMCERLLGYLNKSITLRRIIQNRGFIRQCNGFRQIFQTSCKSADNIFIGDRMPATSGPRSDSCPRQV